MILQIFVGVHPGAKNTADMYFNDKNWFVDCFLMYLTTLNGLKQLLEKCKFLDVSFLTPLPEKTGLLSHWNFF